MAKGLEVLRAAGLPFNVDKAAGPRWLECRTACHRCGELHSPYHPEDTACRKAWAAKKEIKS